MAEVKIWRYPMILLIKLDQPSKLIEISTYVNALSFLLEIVSR